MLCGGICLCAGQRAVIFKGIMVYRILYSEKYKILNPLDRNLDLAAIRGRHLPTGVECVVDLVRQYTTYIHRGDIRPCLKNQESSSK